MKRWRILGIISISVLVLAGLLLWNHQFPRTAETIAYAQGATRSAQVVRGSLEVTIDATGSIEPLQVITVNSKASGKILELLVDEGDHVEEGAVIAHIETTYVQADVDQAEADLAAARARVEQTQTDIKLKKEQVAREIARAEAGLHEAQKRLEQLTEQIRLEKQGNQRGVEEAQNSLMMAELKYELLTSETVRAEEIRRAESSVKQAAANRDLAQKEHERRQLLFDKGYVSRSELDAVQAQWQSTEAQYQSAMAQLHMVEQPGSDTELALAQAEIQRAQLVLDGSLETVEAEKYRDMELEIKQDHLTQAEEALKQALANQALVTMKEKDLEGAQAQVRRCEVQLQLSQERLADTVITAPISGTILQKMVEEGQVITSSLSSVASEGTTLVAMADLSHVYVIAEVDETDIGQIQVEQPVVATLEAYPDQPFDGEVLKVAPRGEVVQNVTTFAVTTELKNPQSTRESTHAPFLKPGMNATVEISIASRQNVLLVPNEAVLERRGGKVVHIQAEDGFPHPQRVETGTSSFDQTEIVSGLKEGQTILVGLPATHQRDDRGALREQMIKSPASTMRSMQGGIGGRQ